MRVAVAAVLIGSVIALTGCSVVRRPPPVPASPSSEREAGQSGRTEPAPSPSCAAEPATITWTGPLKSKAFLAHVSFTHRKNGLTEGGFWLLEQVTPTVMPAELASLLPALAERLRDEGIPAVTDTGPAHRFDDPFDGFESDGRFVTFVGAEEITREFTATCRDGRTATGMVRTWARSTTGILDCDLKVTEPLATLAHEYCPK